MALGINAQGKAKAALQSRLRQMLAFYPAAPQAAVGGAVLGEFSQRFDQAVAARA
jgi:hypothetical protein